jgi:GPI mannosyltransferase 3
MTFSAGGRRLTESPKGQFLPRDWIALLAICLLAVAIRASVMSLLPSILHPDERMWLDAASRLVNHRGLVTWDFQVGERNWLWPGLMAGFMGLGQLFGSPPAAALGGVSVLLCILSLAPVICGFLWGRDVAGFPGAVTAGLLNAVWFELVYFYTHPLSETSSGASLVVGLYLLYPGRGVVSERRIFIGAAMLGLAAVLRPQLIPAIAVAVIAVGGIRERAHYPALLGGLALPIVLSGLLDWVTWGWPFHALIMYVYYQTIGGVGSFFGHNPVYSYIGWQGVAWGLFGIVIVLCALYGALRLPLLFWVAATIFVTHSAVGHKEYRYISPALPLIMTLAAVGSRMATDWLADRLGRPQIRRALVVAVPLVWTIASLLLAASPNRIWFWVRSRGSILAMRAVDADRQACGVGIYPGSTWWRAAGYAGLRPDIPLFDAGETANPVAPNAYNYVISLQKRSTELKHPADLPVDFTSLGYQQVQCWMDPYDRTLLVERMCLWRRPGVCDSKSAKPLTPEVGEAFEELLSR